MNINEYQEWTKTTVKYPDYAEGDYLVTGLVGEVGELMSAMAKFHRGDYGLDECHSRMKKEIGDIMWFLARLTDMYGWSLMEIMHTNMNKLETRKLMGTIKGDGDNR